MRSGLSAMLLLAVCGCKCFRFGPSKFDIAWVYENLAIEHLENAQGRWGNLKVYYPSTTIWSDHPVALLQTSWVTDPQKKAARAAGAGAPVWFPPGGPERADQVGRYTKSVHSTGAVWNCGRRSARRRNALRPRWCETFR
jgi:hypothetical protein